MNLIIKQSHVALIGYMAYQENGFTTLICDIKTANIEQILLESILLSIGDYSITGEFDYNDGEEGDIRITTNLPYSIFEAISEEYTKNHVNTKSKPVTG